MHSILNAQLLAKVDLVRHCKWSKYTYIKYQTCIILNTNGVAFDSFLRTIRDSLEEHAHSIGPYYTKHASLTDVCSHKCSRNVSHDRLFTQDWDPGMESPNPPTAYIMKLSSGQRLTRILYHHLTRVPNLPINLHLS